MDRHRDIHTDVHQGTKSALDIHLGYTVYRFYAFHIEIYFETLTEQLKQAK